MQAFKRKPAPLSQAGGFVLAGCLLINAPSTASCFGLRCWDSCFQQMQWHFVSWLLQGERNFMSTFTCYTWGQQSVSMRQWVPVRKPGGGKLYCNWCGTWAAKATRFKSTKGFKREMLWASPALYETVTGSARPPRPCEVQRVQLRFAAGFGDRRSSRFGLWQRSFLAIVKIAWDCWCRQFWDNFRKTGGALELNRGAVAKIPAIPMDFLRQLDGACCFFRAIK